MLQKKKNESNRIQFTVARILLMLRTVFARNSPGIRQIFARNSPDIRPKFAPRSSQAYDLQRRAASASDANKLGARCRPFLLRRVSSSPVPLGRRLNSFSRRNGLRFLSIHYSATGRRQIQFPLLSTLVLRYLFTLFTFLLFFFFSIPFLFPA